MTRLFYQKNHKIYFDQKAFIDQAKDIDIDMDQIYAIFGIDQSVEGHQLIEV